MTYEHFKTLFLLTTRVLTDTPTSSFHHLQDSQNTYLVLFKSKEGSMKIAQVSENDQLEGRYSTTTWTIATAFEAAT